MGDGGLVFEGPFRNHGDLVAVERQDAEVLESGKRSLLSFVNNRSLVRHSSLSELKRTVIRTITCLFVVKVLLIGMESVIYLQRCPLLRLAKQSHLTKAALGA